MPKSRRRGEDSWQREKALRIGPSLGFVCGVFILNFFLGFILFPPLSIDALI